MFMLSAPWPAWFEVPIDGTTPEPIGLNASVIRLRDGTYFLAWSTRGYRTVREVKNARMFFNADAAELQRMLTKLQRKGISANAVEVRACIGAAPN